MADNSEWDFMNQKGSSKSSDKSRFTIDYGFGVICFFLLIPTLVVAFGEFMDIIDFFEYGGDSGDILVWILYTTTIFSILVISGFYFTDSNIMKSDSIRIGSGIFIITISIVNLISRIYDFQAEKRNFGFDEFWLDYLYWPSTHERLELVFLGVIIGFLIIKKR
ncbi:MAG: hypothetical protein CBD52_004405 [Euryarchaeota archaeon TMED192]|nr:MAG: hypothetical protein CBD52_004405 [Euryarchaeota archaeon TMED192]|tara:strand:+ start:5426 stop:5917 length:492 start_codon:yes stop_codon:yes gene_type:complete